MFINDSKTNITYHNTTDHEMMYNITQTDINEQNLLAAMIFAGCLAGIGLPGNILVLLVFGLKHKPSVYRTIILTLTMYDTLLCGITQLVELLSSKDSVDDIVNIIWSIKQSMFSRVYLLSFCFFLFLLKHTR
jgi:hypothetical protein